MVWLTASKAESEQSKCGKQTLSYGHLAIDFPLRQYLCPQGAHLQGRIFFQDSQKILR